MKLSEMSILPDRAGIATIIFEPGRWPLLKTGGVIALPSNQDAEFYPLMGGEQFLFHQSNQAARITWFGGTDEAPFLVRLRHKTFEGFCDGGEEAFYESLKPTIIRWAEQKWGQEKTLRQGDVFAYPLPAGYRLKGHAIPLQQRWKKKNPQINNCQSVLFGTRHRLIGRKIITAAPIYVRGTQGSEEVVIGSGILEAPDHASRTLPGLHLIVRSNTVDPD